eukprot:scaffold45751_cov29-Tisochrysis_lutea.AAC.2
MAADTTADMASSRLRSAMRPTASIARPSSSLSLRSPSRSRRRAPLSLAADEKAMESELRSTAGVELVTTAKMMCTIRSTTAMISTPPKKEAVASANDSDSG